MIRASFIRRATFAGFALFILLGPAWPVITGNQNSLIRPWFVYRDMGVGFCAVKLEVTDPSGASRRMSVTEALKLAQRPVSLPVRLRTYEAFDLARSVEANLPAGSRLKVEVREAQREGWVLRHDKFQKQEPK